MAMMEEQQMGDVPIMKQPYRAALSGNWKKMSDFYKESFGAVHPPITLSEDTALHISVYSRKQQPLKDLLDIVKDYGDFVLSEKEVLLKQNMHGNTVLHEATITGNLHAVKLLVERCKQPAAAPNIVAPNHHDSSSKLVEQICPELVSVQNNYGETPLFTAAGFADREIVKFLIQELREQIIEDDDNGHQLLKVHRKREKPDGASILHAAILGQHFETALLLLEEDESLHQIKSKSGITALELLATMPSAFKSGSDRMGIFDSLFYYCLPADSIVEQEATPEHERKWQDLESGQVMRSHRASQVASTLSTCIFSPLAWLVKRKRLGQQKRKHVYALKLARILIKKDVTWDRVHLHQRNRRSEQITSTPSLDGAGGGPVDDGSNITGERQSEEITEETSAVAVNSSTAAQRTDHIQSLQEGASNKGKEKQILVSTSSANQRKNEKKRNGKKRRKLGKEEESALFKATRNGIVEIVLEILAEHPQAVEHFNKMGQTILDVAVIHRQKEIFNLVKQMKIPLDRMKRVIDSQGNTLLHHVANIDHYSGGTKPGPALQLQEELKWLERVRKIIPSHYAMLRNNQHKTAKELFNETHDEHLKKAQKWIKETTQSCSTVAALVATVVFAAAYTVPGGANEKGIPNFLNSPYFLIFTISDVVSLASSLTSLVVFLSMLTSPFELNDFRHSLPQRLILGFTLLFFSVITTMLAFGSTILILIQSEKKLTTFLLSLAAFLPVFVFALMQFHMYIAFLGSTKLKAPKTIRKAFFSSLGWEKRFERKFY